MQPEPPEQYAASGSAPAPVGEGERLFGLDAVRGVALLGVFMVNMAFFTLPLGSAMSGIATTDAPWSERAAAAFVHIFFQYKWISMFSLLFGAGLAMQMRRANERQRPFGWLYLRRLLVLMALGIVHALGIWYGDILFLYACVGLPLLGLMLIAPRLSPRALAMIGAGVLAFSLLLSTSMAGLKVLSAEFEPPGGGASNSAAALPDSADQAADASPPAPTPKPEAPEQSAPATAMEVMVRTGFAIDTPEYMDAERRAYRDGPWTDALTFRGVTWVFSVISAMFGYGWHVLAMFFFGVAFMRADGFSPSRRSFALRLGIIGAPIGLACAVTSWFLFDRAEPGSGVLLMIAAPLGGFGAVALCLGYLGLMLAAIHAGLCRPIFRATAGVGRLSLSNYLFQSVVTTALMYWWGFGLFGSVSRPAQIALVVAIYAVQVALSALYLRAFAIGPVEWVWRTLTYGRLQPWRR